jgi:beta-glucuronidase
MVARKPTALPGAIHAGRDDLEDEMGFRTVEVRGAQILLNGSPVFLRGVCIHAEAPYRAGRACNDQDVKTLLGWVRELGGNYVRLAHYPHDERMTRLADQMGIWSGRRFRSIGPSSSTIPPFWPKLKTSGPR